jgi:BlaI family penicillinase repressor
MKKVPRISEAEWDVLSVLWRKSPLAASRVFAELGARLWKLNTVRTFLARLEKKGVIASKEHPEGKVFWPKIARADFVRTASQTFLDRVFEGATGSLLLHFAKRKRLTDAELAELQAVLAQKQKGRKP